MVVGHQHEHLLAVLGRLEGGPQGHLGLAVADVAAHQPVHGVRRLHVVLDVVDGPAWSSVSSKGKASSKRRIQLAVRREGVAGDRLAGGVELQQLAGHLDDGPARPALDGSQALPPSRLSGGAPAPAPT